MTTKTTQRQVTHVGLVPLTSMTHPIGITRIRATEILVGYRPGDFSRAEAAEIVRLLVGDFVDVDAPAGAGE